MIQSIPQLPGDKPASQEETQPVELNELLKSEDTPSRMSTPAGPLYLDSIASASTVDTPTIMVDQDN